MFPESSPNLPRPINADTIDRPSTRLMESNRIPSSYPVRIRNKVTCGVEELLGPESHFDHAKQEVIPFELTGPVGIVESHIVKHDCNLTFFGSIGLATCLLVKRFSSSMYIVCPILDFHVTSP